MAYSLSPAPSAVERPPKASIRTFVTIFQTALHGCLRFVKNVGCCSECQISSLPTSVSPVPRLKKNTGSLSRCDNPARDLS